jgi:hypothetical protein
MTRREEWFLLLLGVFVLAVIVAGCGPCALAPAGEAARRSSCMNNAYGIGLMMTQYAEDHEGDYPPSLGVLLKEGYLTTVKVFLCPSSTDKLPGDFPKDLKNADLAVLNQIEDFGSYAYVKGLRHENSAEMIILYDKPGHHRREGRNCLFDDGHVEWLAEAEFQKRMKEQEARLREVRGGPQPDGLERP